jgi:hypothetical protein
MLAAMFEISQGEGAALVIYIFLQTSGTRAAAQRKPDEKDEEVYCVTC